MPATKTELLRIVVADDHPVYRDGILRALQHSGRFEIAAEASDGHTALRVIAELRPDAALLDVRMPALDALGVLRRLRQQGIEVPVVLLSAFTQPEIIQRALDAGAAAYLSKDATREEILDTLEIAAHGGRVLEDDIAPAHGRPPLIPAERAMLRLLSDGWTADELPAITGLDPGVIEHHLLEAAIKLGTRNATETLARAHARELLD